MLAAVTTRCEYVELNVCWKNQKLKCPYIDEVVLPESEGENG